MSDFSIGKLAESAGVAIDTVRYYERNGLLTPAGRLASGYRRYGEAERFTHQATVAASSLPDGRAKAFLLAGGADLLQKIFGLPKIPRRRAWAARGGRAWHVGCSCRARCIRWRSL